MSYPEFNKTINMRLLRASEKKIIELWEFQKCIQISTYHAYMKKATARKIRNVAPIA